jgi:hypothetical protein
MSATALILATTLVLGRDTANFNRVYKGSIHRYPVTMVLARRGNSLVGMYRYDRGSRDLTLRGTIRGRSFSMNEIYPGGALSGRLRGTLASDGSLLGTWTKPNGSGALRFSLRSQGPVSKVTAKLPANAVAAGPFDGKWGVDFGNEALFHLVLTQVGSELTGFHTVIAENAARFDAPSFMATREPGPGDKPTIIGTVKDGIGTVLYTSTFGGKGTAEIRMQGNKLHWKIVQDSGESLFPKTATLVRR